MEVISLQSGSSGNCVFVRSNDTCVLFDAGISGRKAQSRLAEYGYDIRDCQGLVLSHEHSDHISGVGVFHRKFGLPVYANERTWIATCNRPSTGEIGCPNHFVAGKPFQIGSLRIDPIRTPHDAVDGVCFAIEDTKSGQRFGILTDLGHVFRGLQRVISTLDAVLIESNYDDQMLQNGPYPQHLKNRIAGKHGHISNDDAAQLLEDCDTRQMQWVCLGHLSAHNNSPEVAMATHREKHGDRFPIFCADRDGATPLPKISQLEFSLQARKIAAKPTRVLFVNPPGSDERLSQVTFKAWFGAVKPRGKPSNPNLGWFERMDLLDGLPASRAMILLELEFSVCRTERSFLALLRQIDFDKVHLLKICPPGLST